MLDELALLNLLQLTNSALPVGAYSYSEGLETLVDAGKIQDEQSLNYWLVQELYCGAIRLDAAVMVRAYRAVKLGDIEALNYWNAWVSAARETEELREQSWQMGRALVRLLQQLQPELLRTIDACGQPCNYAIAFAIAATHWQISEQASLLGYLHSWATNIVSAGIKLIPLGQTAGQQLLLNLHPNIVRATAEILSLDDDNLSSCSWGLALASMAHESQYTRLFRS
jgi:urease accessory protein